MMVWGHDGAHCFDTFAKALLDQFLLSMRKIARCSGSCKSIRGSICMLVYLFIICVPLSDTIFHIKGQFLALNWQRSVLILYYNFEIGINGSVQLNQLNCNLTVNNFQKNDFPYRVFLQRKMTTNNQNSLANVKESCNACFYGQTLIEVTAMPNNRSMGLALGSN